MIMWMDYDLILFDICVLIDAIDEFSLSVQDINRVWMPMTSMDLLRLLIESGSGLYWFEYFIMNM
jgi:hypothetical protein